MSNPKVIFFDAGGTLFRPYPSVGAVYARVAAKYGALVEADHVEKIFHEKWHERNGMTSLAGLSSEKIERDWWYGLVKEIFQPIDSMGGVGAHRCAPARSDPSKLPIPFDPSNPSDSISLNPIEPIGRAHSGAPLHFSSSSGQTPFRDFDAFFLELYDLFARAECWRLFDDALPVLDILRAKGYRLGIISNWDHRLFSIVEQLGLSSYFERVTASSAVGTAKPERRIFEAALEAMRIGAAEGLHVGDSLEDDYHGASRVGIRAVLLDRHTKAYNGIIRINTLHELPELIL
jgi:putative hydrolase of the HAD superfamily